MTETTTWFVADGVRIWPVKVVKVNPATIVLREASFRIQWGVDLKGEATKDAQTIDKTVRKRGSYESYFQTWEEAHEFLMKEAEEKLDIARRRLATAQAHMGNIKGMKK